MSEKSRKELLAEIKHLQAEQEEYARENAELRAKLEETQERPFDLEYFVQQAAGDDVAIGITDYIKSLERNKRRLSWENTKLDQQLAEANATIEQMRSALESARDLLYDLAPVGDVASKNVMPILDAIKKADKALSTTPSQEAERQKRIVEAAKAVVADSYAPNGSLLSDEVNISADLIDKLAAAIKEAE